jgi:hypothetical protein
VPLPIPTAFLDNTGIDGLVRNANTAGIDFTQYLDKDREWFVSATAAGSNLTGSKEAIENLQRSSVHYFQRPDADYVEVDPERTSLNGFGGNVQAGKAGGHWNFMTFMYMKSPGWTLTMWVTSRAPMPLSQDYGLPTGLTSHSVSSDR